MTILETLIKNQIQTVLNHMTDKIAEEIVQEILKDQDFRRRMQEIVKQMFDETLRELNKETS